MTPIISLSVLTDGSVISVFFIYGTADGLVPLRGFQQAVTDASVMARAFFRGPSDPWKGLWFVEREISKGHNLNVLPEMLESPCIVVEARLYYEVIVYTGRAALAVCSTIESHCFWCKKAYGKSYQPVGLLFWGDVLVRDRFWSALVVCLNALALRVLLRVEDGSRCSCRYHQTLPHGCATQQEERYDHSRNQTWR